MSTVEKWSPLYLWRAWDSDWQLIGQWSKKPPMWDLVEGGGLTLDLPAGHRMAWNVRGGELRPQWEYLEYILVWPNPALSND